MESQRWVTEPGSAWENVIWKNCNILIVTVLSACGGS